MLLYNLLRESNEVREKSKQNVQNSSTTHVGKIEKPLKKTKKKQIYRELDSISGEVFVN